MNLAHLLQRSGHAYPELPAVALGSAIVHDYATLARRAACLAGGLRALGLHPGDRVALVMNNCPEYLELLFAAWQAGLVAVPINAKLHPDEFAFILDHSGTQLCFVTPDLADAVAAAGKQRLITTDGADYTRLLAAEPLAITEVDPDATAWLFYTSGTTGRPKGAMLTHRNLLVMSWCYCTDVDPIVPGDTLLHAAPMSHGSGLYALPHTARGAINAIPASGGFDPAEILGLIPHFSGLTMFAAPTMVKRLAEYPDTEHAPTAHLKTIIYGGGPMYRADLDRAQQVFGHKLAQIYGQGESPMTITVLDRYQHAVTDQSGHEQRLSSVGRPFTGIEVRVADGQDRSLPSGEIGEVMVRGPSVMAGYWRNPEATAETLRGGWLHTGDLGRMDNDGFLTLTDRSKDLIISGGSNIYPREVEEMLLRHPAVAEVSVIGVPDPDWGERVVAFVVAAREVDIAELDAWCLQGLARFKRPKNYRFVEQLPKNAYGKILKTELRRRMQAP